MYVLEYKENRNSQQIDVLYAGIHYVGKMKEGTETRILSDFLTDGQLLWAPIDDQYDIVST